MILKSLQFKASVGANCLFLPSLTSGDGAGNPLLVLLRKSKRKAIRFLGKSNTQKTLLDQNKSQFFLESAPFISHKTAWQLAMLQELSHMDRITQLQNEIEQVGAAAVIRKGEHVSSYRPAASS